MKGIILVQKLSIYGFQHKIRIPNKTCTFNIFFLFPGIFISFPLLPLSVCFLLLHLDLFPSVAGAAHGEHDQADDEALQEIIYNVRHVVSHHLCLWKQ